MKLSATIRIAARALRRNTLRTILTMLGIIIGVGAVVALVGIGNGAKTQVEKQIASLGENVIQIFTGSTTSSGIRTGFGSAGTLKIEDAEAIAREIPGVIGVSPEARTTSQVAAGNQNWMTQILGESPDYFNIRQWNLIEGSAFTDQDVRGANKVCVIGLTTARELFGDDSPIGQSLRIKQVPFTITGVLDSKGMSSFGSDQDDVVIMPYTTALRRIMGQTTLRSISVQAASANMVPVVQAQIIDLLRQRHRITSARDDDFTVRSLDEIAAAATEASETMTNLLGAIAGVSLVVGGIGIMNIMLVSVTERTREIGIRMAIGAHSSDVLVQFMFEALSLSVVGGIIGIFAGLGTSKWIELTRGWPTEISTGAIVMAFGCSLIIGIFFGFYPAKKASALDPIEALRFE